MRRIFSKEVYFEGAVGKKSRAVRLITFINSDFFFSTAYIKKEKTRIGYGQIEIQIKRHF